MENYGKRWQLRFLAGLLAVFVTLYFTTDLFGGIYADDSPAVVDEVGEPGGEPAEIVEIDEILLPDEAPAEGGENLPSDGEPAESDESAPSEEEPAEGEENVPSEGEPAEGDENVPSEGEPAGDEEIAEDDGIMLLVVGQTYDIMAPDSPFEIDDCTVTIGGKEVTPGVPADVENEQDFNLYFQWHIKESGNHDNYKGCSFVYDNFADQLGGVNIPSVSGVLSNKGIKGTYSIENGTLTITMGDQDDVYSYEGDLNIEGEIELNGQPNSSTGEFQISFGKDWSWILHDPSVGNTEKPTLKVSKTAQGTVQKIGDDYYQDFTITISHDTWSKVDATNVVLTDEHGTFFANDSLSDLKLNGASISADRVSTNGNTDTIEIGDLAKDQTATLTYRMKIDDPKFLVNGTDNWNTARATSDNGGWAEGRDNAKYKPPTVVKSGTLDKTTTPNKIHWTITVDPGIFGNDENFSITDTLSGTGIPTDTQTFAKGDFEPQDDGTYTYKYDTEAPDADPAVNKTVSNKAVLTMKGEKKENTATVTIDATGGTGTIAKNYGTVTYHNDGSLTIPWNIRVTVPDTALKSFKVTDENPDAWKLDEAKAVVEYTTSFRLTVDGTEYTLRKVNEGKYALENGGTQLGDVELNWRPNIQFTVKITDADALKKIQGKELEISYNMAVKDATISEVTNRSILNIVPTTGKIPDKTVEKTFKRPISVTKYEAWHPGANLGNYMRAWEISVTTNDGTSYSAGDKITITDTLPTGYQLIDSDEEGKVNKPVFKVNGERSEGVNYTVTENIPGKFVMEVTLNDSLAADLSTAGTSFSVSYCANMEQTYFEQQTAQDKHQLSLTNTAEAEAKGAKGYASVTSEITVAAPNPILDKGITSEERTTNPDGTKGFKAAYEIKVNAQCSDLSSGDTLRVYDTLGTKLKLVDNSIVIKAYRRIDEWNVEELPLANESWRVNTVSGKSQITFTLRDEIYYLITYEVTGSELLSGSELTDPNYKAEMEQEIENRYGNTVRLSTQNGTTQNSTATISASSFRLNASVSYKLYIEGTKRWPANDAGHPNEITLKLTRTEKYIDPIAATKGGKTEEKEYLYHLTPDASNLQKDTEDEFWEEVAVGADGSWSFTIDNLIVADQKGSEYSYIVEEVATDGYTPTYRFRKNISGSSWDYEDHDADGYVISEKTGSIIAEISNAQTKDTARTGSVRIVKTAANDPLRNPLAGAKFEITTTNGSLENATVSYADDIDKAQQKLTFTTTAATAQIGNLPAGKYVLKEVEAPDGYVRDNTGFEFTVRTQGEVQATSKGNYTFNSGRATITVSNAPTEFSISKFAIGGTKQLDGAVLTITGNADLSKVTLKNGKIITAENGKFEFRTNTKTAIITGLPAGNNYTLTEKVAPKGYEITTEFKFTMNEDGTITPGTTAENGTVNQYDQSQKTIKLYDAPKTGKITIKKVDDQSAPLAGAKFRLTPPTGISVNGAAVTGANVTLKTAAALEFETEGTDIEIDKLPVGKEYTLTEVSAPGGYSLAEDFLFEMKLNNDGDVSAASADPRFENGIAVIQDEKIVPGTLQLAKRGDGGAYLAGAEFTVTTTDGKLNAVTVSNNAKVSVKEEKTLVFNITTAGIVTLGSLTEGTYTLTESAAPGGYIQNTSSFTFTVDQAGLISAGKKGDYTFNGATATLTNKITELRISKTDMTGKQQLPDATLTITKADGEGEKDFSNVTVENANFDKDNKTDTVTLVTGTETAVVKGLPAGKYVLTETVAPDGYAVTTKFGFTVNEDGTVTPDEDNVGNTYDADEKTIRLVDEVIVVKIDKTDLGGNHLSGATIKIRNKDGKSLGKVQVTGASGEVQQGLTSDTIEFTTGEEIAILTGLPKGNYVLTETAAPNDFQKTETEFHFKVNKHGKVGEDTTVGEPAKDILPNGNTITVLNEPIKKEDDNGSDDKKDPNGTTGSGDSQSSGSQSSDDPQSSGSQPSGSQPSGSQPTGTRPSGGTRPTGTTAPTITTAPTTASTSGGSTLTEPDETEPEKTTGKKTKETTEKPAAETTAKTKKTQKNTTAPETDPSKATEPGTLQTDISIGINQVTRDPGIGIDSSQTVNEENPNTGVPFTSVAVIFAAAGALAIVTQKKKK